MVEPLLVLEHEPIAVLSREELLEIAEQIGALKDDTMPEIDPRSTIAHRFALPFYGDVTLLELCDATWRPSTGKLCFIERNQHLMRLRGKADVIHRLNNDDADLNLSEATILQYVAFFCFFVRGDDGPFLMIDRLENSFLPSLLNRAELEDQFREPMLWGQLPNANWRASSLIYYSNALFLAHFTVQPNGRVDMIADTPLLANLDSKIDAPLEFEAARLH